VAGLFDKFREKVISSVWKDKDEEPNKEKNVDDLIALGVLLWEVA